MLDLGWKKIRIRDKHPGSTTQQWIFFYFFVSVCRTKSRKEKNKLASRACRLKKKAQHEANKLKLHGLEEEHSESYLFFNNFASELKGQKREMVFSLIAS